MPIDAISKDASVINSIRNNKVYNYLYLPDVVMHDEVVWLDFINTISRKILYKGLKKAKFHRKVSLTQLGFYLFVLKMTVFLFRKEDAGTQNKRLKAD